jgi:hypothetical protein
MKEEGRRKRFIYVNCGPQLKTDDLYKVGVLNTPNSWIIMRRKPEFEVTIFALKPSVKRN